MAPTFASALVAAHSLVAAVTAPTFRRGIHTGSPKHVALRVETPDAANWFVLDLVPFCPTAAANSAQLLALALIASSVCFRLCSTDFYVPCSATPRGTQRLRLAEWVWLPSACRPAARRRRRVMSCDKTGRSRKWPRGIARVRDGAGLLFHSRCRWVLKTNRSVSRCITIFSRKRQRADRISD